MSDKYVALLRGINVGGNHKVEMKRLKALFESLGYTDVATYINSGNVIFEAADEQNSIGSIVEEALKSEFGFEIPTLIFAQTQMRQIAQAIPQNWQNDKEHKTDVAYLFSQTNYPSIIDELPINREFMDIRYVDGAIFWNVDRKSYAQSRLNKLISHKAYKFMTVRNINTARFLAESD